MISAFVVVIFDFPIKIKLERQLELFIILCKGAVTGVRISYGILFYRVYTCVNQKVVVSRDVFPHKIINYRPMRRLCQALFTTRTYLPGFSVRYFFFRFDESRTHVVRPA